MPCLGNISKRIKRDKWNLHVSHILGSMFQDGIHEYALQFDESNGHLWIIVR